MTNFSGENLNSNACVTGPKGEHRDSASSKYQAYPKYKDADVEWLGSLPDGWKICPLKSLATFSGGGTPSKENPNYWNGDIPWVSPKDMKASKISSTIDKVTEIAIKESSTSLLKEGALLMVVRSGILQHSIPVAINSVPVTLNQDMKALRFNSRLSVEYAMYVISGNQKLLLFLWGKQGATVESIEQEYLANTLFPVPSLAEQEKIVNFLDHETAKIDTLIEKQQQLIQLLKEKRQAVISHAVTKGISSLNGGPNAPMKDSGVEWLGEVPKHWRVAKLGQLAFMQEGPGLRTWQFKDFGVRVICVTNITESGIDFSRLEKFISKEEYQNCYQHFTVAQGDILVSSSGNSWGKVAKYTDSEKVILNTSTIRLNELPHKPFDIEFLQYFLMSEVCREQLGIAMTGSCQPNFGPTHLKEIMAPVPPVDEQRSIRSSLNERLAKFDTPIQECEYAINLMQERRTALISAAVTGKIDVRSWQIPQN